MFNEDQTGDGKGETGSASGAGEAPVEVDGGPRANERDEVDASERRTRSLCGQRKDGARKHER